MDELNKPITKAPATEAEKFVPNKKAKKNYYANKEIETAPETIVEEVISEPEKVEEISEKVVEEIVKMDKEDKAQVVKAQEETKPVKKKGKVIIKDLVTISVQDEEGHITTLRGHKDAQLGDTIWF